MDAREVADIYRQYGYTPFPLKPRSKEPLAKISLYDVDRKKVKKSHNLGLFAGSPNGLAVIDADDERSQAWVTAAMKKLGLWDLTTIVRTPRRGGLHFWLRLSEVPEAAQAYYKLPEYVGGGEFRVHKPAYVVAPFSTVREGEYQFIQGGIEYLLEQPQLPWSFMTWLIPAERLMPPERSVGKYTRRGDVGLLQPKNYRYRPDPNVLRLLDVLGKAEPGEPTHKMNYVTGEWLDETFSSRSEAEFAVIMGLIMAGWSFEDIERVFDEAQPGHYRTVKNPSRYLMLSYNNAVRILLR